VSCKHRRVFVVAADEIRSNGKKSDVTAAEDKSGAGNAAAVTIGKLQTQRFGPKGLFTREIIFFHDRHGTTRYDNRPARYDTTPLNI
jgi:hypothetical protein